MIQVDEFEKINQKIEETEDELDLILLEEEEFEDKFLEESEISNEDRFISKSNELTIEEKEKKIKELITEIRSLKKFLHNERNNIYKNIKSIKENIEENIENEINNFIKDLEKKILTLKNVKKISPKEEIYKIFGIKTEKQLDNIKNNLNIIIEYCKEFLKKELNLKYESNYNIILKKIQEKFISLSSNSTKSIIDIFQDSLKASKIKNKNIYLTDFQNYLYLLHDNDLIEKIKNFLKEGCYLNKKFEDIYIIDSFNFIHDYKKRFYSFLIFYNYAKKIYNEYVKENETKNEIFRFLKEEIKNSLKEDEIISDIKNRFQLPQDLAIKYLKEYLSKYFENFVFSNQALNKDTQQIKEEILDIKDKNEIFQFLKKKIKENTKESLNEEQLILNIQKNFQLPKYLAIQYLKEYFEDHSGLFSFKKEVKEHYRTIKDYYKVLNEKHLNNLKENHPYEVDKDFLEKIKNEFLNKINQHITNEINSNPWKLLYNHEKEKLEKETFLELLEQKEKQEGIKNIKNILKKKIDIYNYWSKFYSDTVIKEIIEKFLSKILKEKIDKYILTYLKNPKSDIKNFLIKIFKPSYTLTNDNLHKFLNYSNWINFINIPYETNPLKRIKNAYKTILDAENTAFKTNETEEEDFREKINFREIKNMIRANYSKFLDILKNYKNQWKLNNEYISKLNTFNSTRLDDQKLNEIFYEIISPQLKNEEYDRLLKILNKIRAFKSSKSFFDELKNYLISFYGLESDFFEKRNITENSFKSVEEIKNFLKKFSVFRVSKQDYRDLLDFLNKKETEFLSIEEKKDIINRIKKTFNLSQDGLDKFSITENSIKTVSSVKKDINKILYLQIPENKFLHLINLYLNNISYSNENYQQIISNLSKEDQKELSKEYPFKNNIQKFKNILTELIYYYYKKTKPQYLYMKIFPLNHNQKNKILNKKTLDYLKDTHTEFLIENKNTDLEKIRDLIKTLHKKNIISDAQINNFIKKIKINIFDDNKFEYLKKYELKDVNQQEDLYKKIVEYFLLEPFPLANEIKPYGNRIFSILHSD